MIPCQPRPQDRRAGHGGISLHHRRQQIEAGLIHENQRSALGFRLVEQPGPSRPPPKLDRLFVPLAGASNRCLRRPSQPLEQSGNLTLVVSDCEFLIDHPGNTGTGPQRSAKSIGLGPVPEELGDHPPLGRRQLRRPAGDGTRQQSRRAPDSSMGKPMAHRYLRYAQRLGDVPLIPVILLQSQRLKSAPLTPIPRHAIRGSHAYLTSLLLLKLFYATVSRCVPVILSDGRTAARKRAG